jgi:hypothetical protein
MVTGKAVVAGIAGNVMIDGYTITLFVSSHRITNGGDDACYLVAQYQRSLINPVPLHHVAATDSTCLDPNKKLVGPYHGHLPRLHTHIPIVVIDSYTHTIVLALLILNCIE